MATKKKTPATKRHQKRADQLLAFQEKVHLAAQSIEVSDEQVIEIVTDVLTVIGDVTRFVAVAKKYDLAKRLQPHLMAAITASQAMVDQVEREKQSPPPRARRVGDPPTRQRACGNKNTK